MEAVDALFGYTGQELDKDAKLYNYNARWYDPTMGRFISEDPSGLDAGDPNLYRYVGNDPIGNTDPTGLQLRTPIQALNSVGILGAGGIGAGYLGLGLNAFAGGSRVQTKPSHADSQRVRLGRISNKVMVHELASAVRQPLIVTIPGCEAGSLRMLSLPAL